MKIGIVGAGIAGMSAAYDLLKAGHEVTLYEASDRTGGLARGFQDERWDWPLEHFYHHIFESDDAILGLVDELNFSDHVFFPTPRTSIYQNGEIYPFSNPVDWWKFPGMDPISYARFGFVGAFLRFTKFWRYLEKSSADSWSQRYYGNKIHNLVFKPLLIGKFGPYYQDVNMAWLWARLHVRSFKLGYFERGFQAFLDRLTDEIGRNGATLHLNTPVTQIAPQLDGRLRIIADGLEAVDYDQVLHTTSPNLLAKITPSLPDSYLSDLQKLKSMGAVVVVYALNESLLNDGTYWLNLPAQSVNKDENEVPFLALVEHTNYIDRKHYGGDRIVYCGDYVTPDHRYMTMPDEEIAALFAQSLPQFNKDFKPEWIRKTWVWRAPYAQPVPGANHSANVPSIETPVSNLFMASMSQVYPWDRGTNFAVEIGRNAAQTMLNVGKA